MRNFFSAFPWNDYCFKNKNATECASVFSEVIQMGIEQYVPFKRVTGKQDSKPWFNKSCSEAVTPKNNAFHNWSSNQSDSNRVIPTKVRDHCKKTIDNPMKSFIQRKADRLAACPSGSNSIQFLSINKYIKINFTNSSFLPLNLSDNSVAIDASDKANFLPRISRPTQTWTTKGLSHPHTPRALK